MNSESEKEVKTTKEKPITNYEIQVSNEDNKITTSPDLGFDS